MELPVYPSWNRGQMTMEGPVYDSLESSWTNDHGGPVYDSLESSWTNDHGVTSFLHGIVMDKMTMELPVYPSLNHGPVTMEFCHLFSYGQAQDGQAIHTC